MKIAVITIGDELVTGRTVDTNTSFIAQLTWQLSWPVVLSLSVGDDERAIADALYFAIERADAVILTGGLGPTADDITTQAVAHSLNLALYTDEQVLKGLQDLFAKYNLKWTENNAKQAQFPVGSEILPNPIGTAPGFALRHNNRSIFVIPGVPREAERMMKEQVIPRLMTLSSGDVSIPVTRTIKTFGLSEAAVDNMLRDINFQDMKVKVGFYPHFPENHIVLTTLDKREAEAKRRIEWAEKEIFSRIGNHIFAFDDETLEGNIGKLLKKRGWKISVAESCTGGLITDRLTDIPGSSDYVERGFVTYSNLAKIELLGVPREVIEAHGAVSEETARGMAEGARLKAQTDVGLAVTGIAGPTGGSEVKPVGTVFIAIADHNGTFCVKHHFRWDRRRNKVISAEAALFLLLNYLRGENGAP